MASYNRVVLLGNLTRDPVVRYLPSGMAVCDLGLAVNDRRKNPNGEWVDEPTFVDITLFDRHAETAGEYLTKGSPVLIEGRLKMDRWQDKNDGQTRTKLKVVGDRLVLVGSRQGGQPAGTGLEENASARPAGRRDDAYSQPVSPSDAEAVPPDPPADDIPF